MPETVETLVDATLRRIRDTGAIANPRATVRLALSGAQQVVNIGTSAQVQSGIITTNAEQLIYQLSSTAAQIGRVLGVAHESRELNWIEWEQLKNFDADWWRRTGPQFQAWSMIGRDLLIIYPALTGANTVQVSYVRTPAVIADDSEQAQIRDDEVTIMVDIAEVLLRVRARQLSGLTNLIDMIEGSVKLHKADLVKRYPLGR